MPLLWKYEIAEAFKALGGQATYSQLYDYIERTTKRTLTKSWQATVRNVVESHSEDSQNFRGENLFYSVNGIGGGEWGLVEYRDRNAGIAGQDEWDKTKRSLLATVPADTSNKITATVQPTPTANDMTEPPTRFETFTYRIIRDTHLARSLKALHGDQCQVCGATVQLANGDTYSEAHHIKPLGSPHNGPDSSSNILVLCPNCHVKCDYNAILLEPCKLRVIDGHDISQDMIDYHNSQFRG